MTIRALTERDDRGACTRTSARSASSRPTHEPRATEYVPQMLDDDRHARSARASPTAAADGDVNFAVRKFPGYGKLSRQVARRAARRRARRRARRQGRSARLRAVEGGQGRASRTTPSGTAPFGPGRPGWHIECSAMCMRAARRALRHPRRRPWTCSSRTTRTRSRRAKARAASRSSTYWMHNGFLNVDNEKMSKSLGNFFTIRDVLKRYDGETIRFFMLRTHYRSPFNFSDAAPRRRAQRAAPALHRARRAWRRPSAPSRLGDAARGRVPRRDERRLQHADRRRGAVRAGRRGEPQHARPPTAALLKALGAHARPAAAGAARVPARRARGARRGRHRRRASPRAPRPRRRATSRAPIASAPSSPAQGIVLKDTPQGTTWVQGLSVAPRTAPSLVTPDVLGRRLQAPRQARPRHDAS